MPSGFPNLPFDRVLGIGSPLVDLLLSAEDLTIEALGAQKGGMALVDQQEIIHLCSSLTLRQQSPGGSAANTIKALAALGHPTAFFGKIGRDIYGDFFLSELQNLHVDISRMLFTEDFGTGCVCCLITPDGERTFRTYLGAASSLCANDLIPELFREIGVIYIEGYLLYQPGVIDAICRWTQHQPILKCFDLASFNVVNQFYEQILQILRGHVHILFANEEEGKALTGKKDPIEMLKIMNQYVPLAIVKVGDQGAYACYQGEHPCYQPTRKVKVQDTTGAGDFWAAGFLYGWLHHYSLSQCLEMGNFLGSTVVQYDGTILPKETWYEIRTYFQSIQK